MAEMTQREYQYLQKLVHRYVATRVVRQTAFGTQMRRDVIEVITTDVIRLLWRFYQSTTRTETFVEWCENNMRVIWSRIRNRLYDAVNKGQIEGYRFRDSVSGYSKHAEYAAALATMIDSREKRSNGCGDVDLQDSLNKMSHDDRAVAEYIIGKGDLQGVLPATGMTWFKMRQSLDRIGKQLFPEKGHVLREMATNRNGTKG